VTATASGLGRTGKGSTAYLPCLLLGLISIAAFSTQLQALINLALGSGEFSHVLAIPFISTYLIWYRRDKIFSGPVYPSHATVLVLAAAVVTLGRASRFLPLPVGIAFLVVFWLTAFVLCYGVAACRAAQFSLLLLFLMVPLPDRILDLVIRGLQWASAEVVAGIFRTFHVPAIRDGIVFSFPQGSIQIASECSGIRSSVAFFLTSLLVAHLALHSAWRKALLVVSVIPMVALKNGIRIATLSVLGFYVDPRFLSGQLHRNGGIIFFLLALVLWAPVVRTLQQAEQRSRDSAGTVGSSGTDVDIV
jgi:exosortase